MDRPLVVLAEPIDAAPAAWLGARCDLMQCPPEDARFGDLLGHASGLIVRTYTRVDERLIACAGRLRVVGRAGVGLDNIDIAACRARGIEVVHTPEANTQAVVEYVILLIGDALRPRTPLTEAVSEAAWHRLRNAEEAGREMCGLTLGILGLGRIGRSLASIAGAIGMEVLYNDLVEIPKAQRFGARPVDVDHLFAAADVVSIHVDGRPSNHGFVGDRFVGRLKPDAVLINASRGFVVDNLSLASFLRENPNAVAMLDVHEPEPFGRDYPLLGLPNAHLFPHLAARTRSSLEAMSWVVRDIWAVLDGRTPRFPAGK